LNVEEKQTRSQQEIHNKGFNMSNSRIFGLQNNQNIEALTEYGRKIKVGVKNLEDATLDLGSY